jgi:hypothetical protein
MANQANRSVPSVYTQIISKINYNTAPLSDVIGIVGPTANGPLETVTTTSNPTDALNTFGACRLTNQAFAAWAGGAGTIKIVRIGGTVCFDSVLYGDNDSPDATLYNITNFMCRRNDMSSLYDFYDTVSGQFSPSMVDAFGSIVSDHGDVIFAISNTMFDTLDFVFPTAVPSGTIIRIAYYNADTLQTANQFAGYTAIPGITLDDVAQLNNALNISGLTSTHIEWDVADMPDWEQATFTDSDGQTHSGYAVAIWADTTSAGDEFDISRICQRIGAEGSYHAWHQATYASSGIVNGATTNEVFMLTSKNASSDAITVETRLVGPKIYLTVTRTDSLGVVTTEEYTVLPVFDALTSTYSYTTEDLIDEINETSVIVTATDLSTTFAMFGWATPTTAVTTTLLGASASPSSITLKDYARGLALIAREADIYWVLPCIDDNSIQNVSGYTDNAKFLAIMQLFYTHVINMSVGLNQKPRVLMSWLSPGYQNVGTIGNSNLNIKSGSSRRIGASERNVYFVQKLGFYELEASGSLTYRREYLASYTAGLLSALNAADPATRDSLGVGSVDYAYDADEMEILIRNGVFAYQDVPGIGVCVGKAITSKLSDARSAVTTTRVADRIAIDMTALLERRYIGRARETGVTEEIKRDVASYLTSKIAPAAIGGLIDAYDSIICYPDSNNANKVILSYKVQVKGDLDFIDQTVYLTTSVSS